MLYVGEKLLISIDQDASHLPALLDVPLFLLVLLALVWQAVARAGDRSEVESASRLDQTQLRSMIFATGEWVGSMVCEESNPPTFASKSISRSWHLLVTELLVLALLAAISAVKFSKVDQTWILFAVLLVLIPAVDMFLKSRIRLSGLVKALSIEHVGAPNALVTVNPVNPRQEAISLRRVDLDRVRLEMHGPSCRKQLSFTAPSGCPESVPATLFLRASSESDDLSVERLHHAIASALAVDASVA